MSAWTTTVGRLRRAPPACAEPGVATGPVSLSGRIGLADGDQGVRHALVEGCAISTAARGSGNERTLDDEVLVVRKRAGQCSTSIVEAEGSPGIGARRLLVGLVPRGQRELADLLGRPVRGLFGQPGVRLGLGHLDEWLHLVKGELSLRQRIGDLGEGRKLGRRGHPLRAVAAETAHRCTSQATMEVAPSTRQARRRSSSATAARSWLWCAEIARWCWVTLDTSASVRRDTVAGRGPSLRRAGAMRRMNGRSMAPSAAVTDKAGGTCSRSFGIRGSLTDSGPPGPTLRDCARASGPADGSPPPGCDGPRRRRRGRTCRSRRG